MSEENFSLIAFGLFLGFIFIVAITMLIYYKIKEAVMNQKLKKDMTKYPEFFEKVQDWYDFRDKAYDKLKEIDRQKEKIDSLLKELKYLPKEKIYFFEKEIEEERKKLQLLLEDWNTNYCKRYNNLATEWNEDIAKYAEKNKIVIEKY